MRTFIRAVVGLVVGYFVGALIGAGLVEAFSANIQDKPLELAMTAAFVTGPLGAVLGLVAALLMKRRG